MQEVWNILFQLWRFEQNSILKVIPIISCNHFTTHQSISESFSTILLLNILLCVRHDGWFNSRLVRVRYHLVGGDWDHCLSCQNIRNTQSISDDLLALSNDIDSAQITRARMCECVLRERESKSIVQDTLLEAEGSSWLSDCASTPKPRVGYSDISGVKDECWCSSIFL